MYVWFIFVVSSPDVGDQELFVSKPYGGRDY